MTWSRPSIYVETCGILTKYSPLPYQMAQTKSFPPTLAIDGPPASLGSKRAIVYAPAFTRLICPERDTPVAAHFLPNQASSVSALAPSWPIVVLSLTFHNIERWGHWPPNGRTCDCITASRHFTVHQTTRDIVVLWYSCCRDLLLIAQNVAICEWRPIVIVMPVSHINQSVLGLLRFIIMIAKRLDDWCKAN